GGWRWDMQPVSRRAGGRPDGRGVLATYWTQPLALLLHSGCMAKVPVPRLMPCRFTHAHRSPFSSPLARSTQPEEGPGAVAASAYSCPPTMLNPSSELRTE